MTLTSIFNPLCICITSTIKSSVLQQCLQCLFNKPWNIPFHTFLRCAKCGGKHKKKDYFFVCGLCINLLFCLSIQISKSKNTTSSPKSSQTYFRREALFTNNLNSLQSLFWLPSLSYDMVMSSINLTIGFAFYLILLSNIKCSTIAKCTTAQMKASEFPIAPPSICRK